ncbi:DMT family transporter [Utexia brackfieldae]|uniref:EamA family transporter n=1 Tax=Utexia brackfieldae TaxID=3074108 RepID=UPI00370D0D74
MKSYGPLFVAIGAISYGMPATLMKLANQQTSYIASVLFFLFLCSMLFLQILSLITSAKAKPVTLPWTKKGLMILSGTSIALTNTCYFLSLSYVPVAVAAVMLMQSVWLAILLGCLINRRYPSKLQLGIVILILFGTVLATDVLNINQSVSIIGLTLGFLAAFCYALTIQFTSKLCTELPAIKRASLMSIGAFIFIAIIWGREVSTAHIVIELKWGALISIFAMVLPLACLSIGMPKTAPGIGEIISSLELPAAILFALIFLNEQINLAQLLGVSIIILAVILTRFAKTESHQS